MSIVEERREKKREKERDTRETYQIRSSSLIGSIGMGRIHRVRNRSHAQAPLFPLGLVRFFTDIHQIHQQPRFFGTL